MIYSKKLQTYVPVRVEKTELDSSDGQIRTRYIVKDGRIPVGKVGVTDMPDGVFVRYISNYHPDLYSGFGKVADQIEVEHCLNRGLTHFAILSEAALNSHALHYLRGKRFVIEKYNDKVKTIIENTPKGQMYETSSLGAIPMYMPQALIKKYIEIIKTLPLLKK